MVLSVDGAALSALLLASVRVVAWLVIAPPFGTRGIPTMAKIVLALGLSLAVAPTLAAQELPGTTPGLLIAAATQALIGVGMGYVTMLLFAAIGAAGAMIDIFGGFAVASAWDPLSMNTNTVFGRFHQLLATALLLATGGHLIVIGGLLSTFKYLPLTGLPDLSSWDGVVLTAFSMFFTVAVQMALPMIAVLFVTDLALALLTKVAPQLNALSLMFPAKVGMTLLLLGLSFPMLPGAVDRLVNLATEAMATMAGAG